VNAPNWHQPQQYGPPHPQARPHSRFQPVQHYPQQHPGAEIAITAKASPLTFPVGPLIYLFRVRAAVDGRPPQLLRWGRCTLFVPPGSHHVRLFLNYRLVRGVAPMQVGEGLAQVNLGPGQRAELEYRAPWFVFVPGSLGRPPQPRRAFWLWLAAVSFTLVVFAACIFEEVTKAG
jgi:hypothetical protein